MALRAKFIVHASATSNIGSGGRRFQLRPDQDTDTPEERRWYLPSLDCLDMMVFDPTGIQLLPIGATVYLDIVPADAPLQIKATAQEDSIRDRERAQIALEERTQDRLDVEAKILTANEVRAKRGLPPLP